GSRRTARRARGPRDRECHLSRDRQTHPLDAVPQARSQLELTRGGFAPRLYLFSSAPLPVRPPGPHLIPVPRRVCSNRPTSQTNSDVARFGLTNSDIGIA